MADAFEFCRISHPVVERFILPERFTGPAQGRVCVARRDPLHDVGDFGQGNARFQENMHMIRHDHVGVQDVATEFRTSLDWVFSIGGNFRVAEPAGPEGGGVEVAVEGRKLFTRGCGGAGQLASHTSGKRAIQTPSEEDGAAIRNPVGEIAAVEGHGVLVAQPFLAVRFCLLGDLTDF
jgi:hypothetical protein